MSITLLLISLIAFTFAACAFVADKLTKPEPEPYERKTVPFTSRHLKRDEISTLVHQIAIIDAIHPIGPANYHDATKINIESLVSERLGRRFQISPTDWFNIARAWHVTRDQDLYERCERLELRLALNI